MDNKSNANAMVLQQNGLRYVMPKPLSTSLVRTFKNNMPKGKHTDQPRLLSLI